MTITDKSEHISQLKDYFKGNYVITTVFMHPHVYNSLFVFKMEMLNNIQADILCFKLKFKSLFIIHCNS